MPSSKKQQKLSTFTSKKTGQDDDNSNSSQSPMEDPDVHVGQQREDHQSSTGTANKDQSPHEDTDDATVPIDNTPELVYTRCDVKISIQGTTTDHYLDSLQQLQALFARLKRKINTLRLHLGMMKVVNLISNNHPTFLVKKRKLKIIFAG